MWCTHCHVGFRWDTLRISKGPVSNPERDDYMRGRGWGIIREAGDVGRPAALQTATSIEKAFEELTRNIVQEVVGRNENLPPTEAIKITTMAGCSAVKK